MLSTMGKKGDPKVPILPSRTRRGTALSTSAKLDSPSVMSQFDSPQLHATSTESGNMSDSLMMLLLPLRLQVHLVLLLKNRLLLLPDSRELKFLLPKHLLEKLITLLALRRNSLRRIILRLMMIFAGILMNVLIPTLLL